MGVLERKDWSLGWVPDADAVNGPVNGALRMDNLQLDEAGVLGLRLGSTKINGSPFADTDVHSLYTAVLSGTRYRLAGANNAVYSNGSSLVSGLAGSGDIAFGTHQGQVFMARSTSKKKYDGSTVRNWGVSMTGGTPTAAALAPDKKVFASCDSGAGDFTWTEDDGTGASYRAGYDGSANGAALLRPNTTTGRGVLTKTFGATTDFTTYDAGATGSDDDVISLWLYLTEPAVFTELTMIVDVNPSAGVSFTTDYYVFHFIPTPAEQAAVTPESDIFDDLTGLTGYQRAQAKSQLAAAGVLAPGTPAFVLRPDAGSWYQLRARRGDFIRVGATVGKNWSTVDYVRIVAQLEGGGSTAAVAFDDIRISGGTQRPITGKAYWKYVYVYNSGTYTAKSAPSTASAAVLCQTQGETVTVPADASRDSQVNEIWLFRQDDQLDQFYRTAVKTGVSGTGSVAIADILSDQDALVLNIPLELDNAPPPDNIISIAGPYYDRIFALTTTDLYPSKRLNPDSFSAGQVIHIAGADEVAYWVKKTLGGLYIGTSKDIYRLEGTGAELPDGSIDFTLSPINIDHPPINDAIAQDGNLLLYFANDGWRTMAGQGSAPLAGATSLLYRGYTRHGVSPVNVTTGRFRGAIAKGQLVALTPEGASTTSSTVLYRHVPARQTWYRAVYAQTMRCVYREPDGTLIASDSSGFVWVLDSGTTDGGTSLAVTLWTKVDDNGISFARKDPGDLRIKLDTGNQAASIALHLDGASGATVTETPTANGMTVVSYDLAAVASFKQLQLRVTVTTAAFKWYEFLCGYRDLPTPIIGLVPSTNAGYPGEKVLTGLKIKLCTVGAARTITPYLDGVALAQTFTITTATDEAETHILQFTATQTGTDIMWATDGDTEVFEWEPLVLYQLPTRIKVWENKPMVPSASRRRFGGLTLQVHTHGVAATATPVLDGVDQSTLATTTADLLGKTLTFASLIGRDLWCRITSATPFNPHSVEPIVLETLPQAFKGITPKQRFGYQGVKTASGIQIRLCTFAVARTITVVLDGVALAQTFAVTTDPNEPEEHTLDFTAAREFVDAQLSFDADVELYDWKPLVSARRPLGVTAWDSGPLDLGDKELVWLREMYLKVRASAALTVTPWFDGTPFAAVTVTPAVLNADTIVRIPVGRRYVGRQPRLVVTSSGAFYPYWIKCVRRTTGQGSQKPALTVPVTLETGG